MNINNRDLTAAEILKLGLGSNGFTQRQKNELRRTESLGRAIKAHQDGDTARLEAITREIRGLEGRP